MSAGMVEPRQLIIEKCFLSVGLRRWKSTGRFPFGWAMVAPDDVGATGLLAICILSGALLHPELL